MLVQEFRTGVVPPAERWDLWQGVATRTHVPTLMRSERNDDFEATMRVLPLPSVSPVPRASARGAPGRTQGPGRHAGGTRAPHKTRGAACGS
ncbi:hypothetical protein [Streptomyces sp. XY152]|uniref:hypothetical protein n=1 Tax=Streptomyces sp. XY152 TaxID=1415560 RepID=UPI0006AF3CD5|nr:hypothetical protein [Streptomyces sp. XY152]KOV26558.1 hypothetical protein ADK58_14990 [Streptomyces sp. XY152]